MTMTRDEDENIIVDDNDYVDIAGPIWGTNPGSGARDLYHGADVVGFIAASANSNTPIGGLTYASAEIGETGKYPIAFDGADITSALAALADGTVVYRVIRAPGNFRVYKTLTYRKARPDD
jgi:hypothetical protein